MATHQEPLLSVRNLKSYFPQDEGTVKAVDGATFDLFPGQTLGIVGESGCGKTTTARCILRAVEPTRGQILFRTQTGGTVEMPRLNPSELRGLRRDMQMIFQDPFTSLNPRMTLLDIVGEPLLVHGMKSRREREARVSELLRKGIPHARRTYRKRR
jgi:ABC-type glutathione transport system ATPase component